jgi:hypothetical protein
MILEQKNATMFEIMNNIVKELSLLKNVVINNEMYDFTQKAQMQQVPMQSEQMQPVPMQQVPMQPNNEEEEEYDYESEYDDTSDDEYEEEKEGDIKKINMNEENMKLHVIHETEYEDSEKVDMNADEKEMIEDDISEIINSDDADEISEKSEIEQSEEKVESIHINKLEETIEIPENMNLTTEDKESYKRMNIQQLKTLVISKGLATETNKLKKNDLIRLLETMD